MGEIRLDATGQRVLGALMEKQITVPGSYPLSLNGLQTACNQTSSRDPVTDIGEEELNTCLRRLKDRELIRFVWTGNRSRVLKYHQRLDEHLELADDERALITVLMLRGPQSVGELKTRTERLFPFADKDAVAKTLNQLAARRLVGELARAAGQRDPRWGHLLAADIPAASTHEALAEGPAARDAKVRASYDQVAKFVAAATDSSRQIGEFDQWLLQRFAGLVSGPVADVGCGSGETTAQLAQFGVEVTGFDFAPQMVAAARQQHCELRFAVADLTALLRPPASPAWGGIVAWQSLVHYAANELAQVFTNLARVLATPGWLLAAIHIGEGIQHLDSLAGATVDLDVVLHDPQQVLDAAANSGLSVCEWYIRGPLPSDPQTNLYFLACTDPNC